MLFDSSQSNPYGWVWQMSLTSSSSSGAMAPNKYKLDKEEAKEVVKDCDDIVKKN